MYSNGCNMHQLWFMDEVSLPIFLKWHFNLVQGYFFIVLFLHLIKQQLLEYFAKTIRNGSLSQEAAEEEEEAEQLDGIWWIK